MLSIIQIILIELFTYSVVGFLGGVYFTLKTSYNAPNNQNIPRVALSDETSIIASNFQFYDDSSPNLYFRTCNGKKYLCNRREGKVVLIDERFKDIF